MEVDREPILGGGDQHTLAQALTGKQTHAFGALQLLGHTHHTVARHGGVAAISAITSFETFKVPAIGSVMGFSFRTHSKRGGLSIHIEILYISSHRVRSKHNYCKRVNDDICTEMEYADCPELPSIRRLAKSSS